MRQECIWLLKGMPQELPQGRSRPSEGRQGGGQVMEELGVHCKNFRFYSEMWSFCLILIEEVT